MHLHQTWKTAELPAWSLHETWKQHMGSRFEYTLHDDATVNATVEEFFPEMMPYWRTVLRPVQRADVFRYLILWLRGGIYADIDTAAKVTPDKWVTRANKYVRCTSSGLDLDPKPPKPKNGTNATGSSDGTIAVAPVTVPKWHAGDECRGAPRDVFAAMPRVRLVAGFEQVSTRRDWADHYAVQFQMCQWTMGAEPLHPVMGRVLERILRYFEEGRHKESQTIVKSTGPGIWSEAVGEHLREVYGVVLGEEPHGAEEVRDAGVHVGDMIVLPQRGFAATVNDMVYDPVRFVEHAFSGTWKEHPATDLEMMGRLTPGTLPLKDTIALLERNRVHQVMYGPPDANPAWG